MEDIVVNQVYSKNEFVIISMDTNFIVINKKKPFKEGHTHIENFKTAKYLIDMVIHQRMPYHLPIYLLISLQRLSDDAHYIERIEGLIRNKLNKNQQYVNR